MRRSLCLLPIALGAAAYAVFGHPTLPIGQFELAGDAATARDLVEGRVTEFREALWADWLAFIPGYTLTILLSLTRLRSRRLARVMSALALAAAVCDVVENYHLYQALGNGTDASYAAGAAWATTKFVLLAAPLATAVVALVRKAR